MSAFIVNPEHIGILAAYAATNDCAVYEWRKNTNILTAQNVAKGLALENIRSVAHRYPNVKDGQRPGPGLKDADIVEAKRLMADYQAQRSAHARAEYAAAKRDGTAETFRTVLRNEPLRVVLTILAIACLLGLVALPVFLLRG